VGVLGPLAVVILAGRIVAGWVHLALFRPAEPGPHLLRSASLPADEHGGLRPIVRRFVAEDRPALRAVCLAVPGPVIQGVFEHPDLPWPVRAAELAEALGLSEAEEVEVIDAGALEEATLQGVARRAARLIEGGAR
jgi:glucokinase